MQEFIIINTLKIQHSKKVIDKKYRMKKIDELMLINWKNCKK